MTNIGASAYVRTERTSRTPNWRGAVANDFGQRPCPATPALDALRDFIGDAGVFLQSPLDQPPLASTDTDDALVFAESVVQ